MTPIFANWLDTFFDSFWGPTALRTIGGISAVLLPAGVLVYVYLFKMMSFMQSRLGPMEAGPAGSLQLLAEVGKAFQKEDIFPRKADRVVFARRTGFAGSRWSPRAPARSAPPPNPSRRLRAGSTLIVASVPWASPPSAGRGLSTA